MNSVASYCALFDVFMLSFRFRMATFHVRDSNLSEKDVRDIIAVEISRFMREVWPSRISTVRDELIQF